MNCEDLQLIGDLFALTSENVDDLEDFLSEQRDPPKAPVKEDGHSFFVIGIIRTATG